MLSLKTTVADQSSNTTTDATFAAITGLAFSFQVEEDAMWCLIKMKALVSNHIAKERVDLDAKLNGVFVGGGNGMGGTASAAADSMEWLEVSKLVMLNHGTYTLSGWFKSSTDTDVATVHGTVFPCELSVLRLSNSAVLAHGVGAKFQVTE